MAQGWLLSRLGDHFTLLAIEAPGAQTVTAHGLTAQTLHLTAQGNAALRDRLLGAAAGAIHLIRPDQHAAARWTRFCATAMAQALSRAIGHS